MLAHGRRKKIDAQKVSHTHLKYHRAHNTHGYYDIVSTDLDQIQSKGFVISGQLEFRLCGIPLDADHVPLELLVVLLPDALGIGEFCSGRERPGPLRREDLKARPPLVRHMAHGE